MNTHTDRTRESGSQSVANGALRGRATGGAQAPLAATAPGAETHEKLQEMADGSPRVSQLRAIREMANNSPRVRQLARSRAKVADSASRRDLPVQRRFVQDGVDYSFLSVFDREGNPYLASETMDGPKNWKIRQQQTGVLLEEVNDLYEPTTREDRGKIYHNLSMGREQRVNIEGQRGILNPFKSYQFGADKVPDVAVFNIGDLGAEPGRLYPHYYGAIDTIKREYLDDGDSGRAIARLQAMRSQMMPLIYAEDYRTSGALDHFDKVWNNLNVAFLDHAFLDIEPLLTGRERQPEPGRPRRGVVTERDLAIADLAYAVRNATTNLPWAGTRGKGAFRKSTDSIWQESERPIDRRGASPEKEDVGGKWSKMEEM